MTIFEHIQAFVSILAGLAVARLLHALPFVFLKERRFWIHSLIFIYTISNVIAIWWGTMSQMLVEQWNILKFSIYIFIFSTVYLQCDIVSPSNAENINSWKEYFSKIRFKFYLTYLFCNLSLFINQVYVLPVGLTLETTFIHSIWAILCILGMLYTNIWIQGLVTSLLFFFSFFNGFFLLYSEMSTGQT